MAHERICVVCGTQYRYCKHCQEFAHLPTWMYAYCSEPCKETYMILNKYDFKHITADEAKDALDAQGVNIKNPEMLKSVEEIKKEVKANKKKSKTKSYKAWIPGRNKEIEEPEEAEETEEVTETEMVNEQNEHDEHVDIVNLID